MKNESLPPVSTYPDNFKVQMRLAILITFIFEIPITYFFFHLRHKLLWLAGIPPTPLLLLGIAHIIGIGIILICIGVLIEDKEASEAEARMVYKEYNVNAKCAKFYLIGGFSIIISLILGIVGLIQNYRNGHLW
jgi:hypothetical protein